MNKQNTALKQRIIASLKEWGQGKSIPVGQYKSQHTGPNGTYVVLKCGPRYSVYLYCECGWWSKRICYSQYLSAARKHAYGLANITHENPNTLNHQLPTGLLSVAIAYTKTMPSIGILQMSLKNSRVTNHTTAIVPAELNLKEAIAFLIDSPLAHRLLVDLGHVFTQQEKEVLLRA